MTHLEAIQAIDRMAKCGVRSLKISGGEPFVREDFWSLVDYTLEKGLKIDKIYTNGWLLMDSVLDQFEQRGLYGFAVFTTVVKLTDVDFLGQFNIKAH